MKIIDREHKAMAFNIAGLLDGYRYSTTLKSDDGAANLSTNDASLPTTKTSDGSITETAIFKVNVNCADAVALQRLPGIGPVLAERIIALRDSIGEYAEAEELLDVPGIGEKKLARIREFLEF